MKKVSALILSGILGSSMLFAGFSGSANVDAKYGLDSGDYGFANSTNVTFDVNVKEELGAKKGEGKVFAEINGKLTLNLFNGQQGENSESNNNVANGAGKVFTPVKAEITDAKIMGDNWSVDIKGVPGGPDLASSAIEEYVDVADGAIDDWGFPQDEVKKAVTYKVAYEKAAGVAVSYDAFKVGVGLFHDKSAGTTDASVYAGVEDLMVADGVKASLVAVASQNPTAGANRVVGASAKVAYAMDDMEVMAATDMGYDLTAKKFDTDVSAKVKYAPVTVDAYFATNATKIDTATPNLLSAKVATDLKSFDVPVVLTVTGKDLINTQDLSAEAKVTVAEGLDLTVKGGYNIGTAGYSAGLAAEYMMDKVGKIKANFDYAKNNVIGAGVSVENTTLIDGATLSAGWYDAEDLLSNGTGTDKLGTIKASCKIAF